jgi:hypothetical protein
LLLFPVQSRAGTLVFLGREDLNELDDHRTTVYVRFWYCLHSTLDGLGRESPIAIIIYLPSSIFNLYVRSKRLSVVPENILEKKNWLEYSSAVVRVTP